ncbi:MAG: Putative sulfate permease [Ktedonobacterales bacterium]|jgi:uncharacterized membrane protein YfcA|nr:MAG: Putative sulfate permease [Ktedonobacterales bacterium]
MDARFIFTGLLVGMLVGLTGMGGGSLMTPILVLLLGVKPTLAVGTDLAYATVTKAVGALQHLRQTQIKVWTSIRLSLGSVPASILGVGLIAHLRHIPGVDVEDLVAHAVGAMLIIVAVLLVAQPFIRNRLWPEDRPNVFFARLEVLRRFRTPILIVIGAIVGFLVGLTSVGGGSLVMIALLLVYPRWKMSRRVGTDVLQGCLLSAAAAAAHWTLGDVAFPIVGQLLIGSIPGVLVGSRMSKVVPEIVLRPAVAGVLLLSALRLLAII